MTDTLRDYVAEHFGGIIREGKHEADGQACILEARNAFLGHKWSDSPIRAGRPDIRPLNDALWSSDALRTEQMLRLDEALEPWAAWTQSERASYRERVVRATVCEIIAELPLLASAKTAEAAMWAIATDSARAAEAALMAANGAQAADSVLIRAVDLWIQAVEVPHV